MTSNGINNGFTLNTGLVLGGERFALSIKQINYISDTVTRRVNGTMGRVILKGVGTDLINDQFATAERGFNKRMSDRVSVLETIIEEVINIISVDAIAFYGRQQTEKNRSIWNSDRTRNPSQTDVDRSVTERKYKQEQELRF
jgi:hypothetical protein